MKWKVIFEMFSEILAKLDRLENLVRKETKEMSNLDDKIAALQTTVTAEEGVEDSAIALIQGFNAELQAIIAQGATPAALQALTDLSTSIGNKSADLAAAVAANQPPPPPGPGTGTPVGT